LVRDWGFEKLLAITVVQTLALKGRKNGFILKRQNFFF